MVRLESDIDYYVILMAVWACQWVCQWMFSGCVSGSSSGCSSGRSCVSVSVGVPKALLWGLTLQVEEEDT